MNENNVISFFNDHNGKTYTNNKGKKIKLDLTSLDVFKEKMSTKEKRRKMFDTVWGAGINLFGKYADFEKKYGNTTSTQTTAVTKLDLQKLLKIDSTIKETTRPDQVIYTSDDKSEINIFFSDGNFRLRSNSVNNKNGEITGRWKFLGNDSYQINTSDGDVYIYGEGWKGVPTTSETTGGKLDLQKLMKIDSAIKKTTSPDQAISRFTEYTNDNRKIVWIFFSDGNWKQRINSVNNKVDEAIGKWYFTDNEKNYQIKSKTYGDTFDFKTKKWVMPNSPSKTWNEVSFTLDDILSGKGVLKKGDKGPVVTEVQKIMIELNLGSVSKSGKPDGYFGKRTDLAVKQFQGNNMARGQQDGKVGQRTLKRMIELRDYDGSEPETNTNQPQMPLDGQNVEPQTSQPQIPAGGENTTTAAPDTTQAPTATQPKKKLTLSPINEQENIKKIVYGNLKSLLK